MITILQGDSRKVLKQYPDNFFDAVVTDPPYGLTSKEPNIQEVLDHWLNNRDYDSTDGGFMNKSWDSFVPNPSLWREVYRVLKPGGHMLVFAGTRTVDLMGISLRLAGFEIRDTLQWIYGSGFPKSYNIAKGIEGKLLHGNANTTNYKNLAKKNEREQGMGFNDIHLEQGDRPTSYELGGVFDLDATTPEAQQWDGWGTALKPANEPIILARKPLSERTIADNVLKWGTGGINIDGCRVGTETIKTQGGQKFPNLYGNFKECKESYHQGRFPANVVFTHHPDCKLIGTETVGTGPEGGYSYDGKEYKVEGFVKKCKPKAPSNRGKETVEKWDCHKDCPVRMLNEQSGVSKGSDKPRVEKQGDSCKSKYGGLGYNGGRPIGYETPQYGDSGGASRFFYCAKASKKERNMGLEDMPEVVRNDGRDENLESGNMPHNRGNVPKKNHHPTVKPLALMQYLVRLVTPPNGTVLDPFVGSGTTALACTKEGFGCVGIDITPEYVEIAKKRCSG